MVVARTSEGPAGPVPATLHPGVFADECPSIRVPRRMPPSAIVLVPLGLALASAAMAQQRPSGDAGTERPAGIAASRADLLAMTPLWKGDRYPDGGPRSAMISSAA